MKFLFISLMLLSAPCAYCQQPAIGWKRSVVKIESVIQRYNQQQVDELLKQRLNILKRGISQHETFEIRDSLESISDTIRGTGTLIGDGNKLYIVTAKHLLKATAPYGNSAREVITNLLTIHLARSGHNSNNINLSSLISISPASSPVVFSDDKTDLAIISLQQSRKKTIVNYIRQHGAIAIPVQNIQTTGAGSEITTVGFLAINQSNVAIITKGKIKVQLAMH